MFLSPPPQKKKIMHAKISLFQVLSLPRIAFIGLLLCCGYPAALYSDDAEKSTRVDILNDIQIKQFLQRKDIYTAYLPELEKDTKYKKASKEERGKRRKEAFLTYKYKRIRYIQITKLMLTMLKILGLPVGWACIICLLPSAFKYMFNYYFSIKENLSDTELRVVIKKIESSGLLKTMNLLNRLITADIILERFMKRPPPVMSSYSLAKTTLSSLGQGTPLKKAQEIITLAKERHIKPIIPKNGGMFDNFESLLKNFENAATMFQNYMEGDRDSFKKLPQEIFAGILALENVIDIKKISPEWLVVKSYQKMANTIFPGKISSIFSIAYSTLVLGAKQSWVLLALLYFLPSPTAGFILLNFIYKNFRENILTPITYLLTKKGVLIDPIEESELLLIENWDRLTPVRKKVLQERLLDARKNITKRSTLKEYVLTIVQLPTLSELQTPIVDTVIKEEDIDMSLFKYYEAPVNEVVIRLYQRAMEGVRPYGHPYFVGPSGSGKTEISIRLGLMLEERDVVTTFINLAGATVEDIIGTAYGKPGLIIKSLIQASPYGTKQIILCFDEIDKALKGPHKQALTQLFLKMFDTSSKGYASPYLPGEDIPLPNIIIFMGNYEIKGPFANRLERIAVDGYKWEILEKLLREKTPEFCDRLKISTEKFGPEEYKAINAFFIKKEIPYSIKRKG